MMNRFQLPSNAINPKYFQYLTASWHGMFYLIIGVVSSYLLNRLFDWADSKLHTENNNDIPTWKVVLKLWLQTCLLIGVVILIKKYVPKIPDPFEVVGVEPDTSTGTVLIAFATLMYMDNYKNNIHILKDRILGLF